MSANKVSSLLLLSLSLALVGLLGVFAIIDASAANASQGEVPLLKTSLQPGIIVFPSDLHAMLRRGEYLTQTLWITNTGDSDLSFTIYEMTGSLQLEHYLLDPISVPLIDSDVQAQVSTRGSALAIILLRERPDLASAYQLPIDARAQFVYNLLLEAASRSQALFDWLDSQGTQPQRLLTANAIAATLNSTQLTSLARNPQVKQISLNHQNAIISPSTRSSARPGLPALPSLQPRTIEWNIAKIRADETWSTLGITGEGAVVGIMDTGVMFNHSALINSYRGNLGGGNFDHNYNWYDFVNGALAPYDDNGHGTMITGIVSGDDGGGNQIGVAPGADWIAVKACSAGGFCSDVALHTAFQWMIAPINLDGTDPDPSKAPQVVLGGWGTPGCSGVFELDIMALRAAGILPVFSTGAGGPACDFTGSPADLPDVLAAGETDVNDDIAPFSARGPSCYGEIKPDVTAPGVEIRSSYNDGGYQTWSGAAESAAHAAGVSALIISTDPNLGPNEVEDFLFRTALCLQDLTCGGDACPDPNNVFGHGRIDAYEAVNAALGNPPHVELPWLDETPISATLPAGSTIAVDIIYDSTGLNAGTHMGALGILSNDPAQPFISIPVTLDVTALMPPVIGIDPLSFSATLPVGGIQTDTLTIVNQGEEVLTFSLGEVTGTQRLASQPVEPSITGPFQVNSVARVDAKVRSQLLFLNKSRLIIFLRGQPDVSVAENILDRTARVQFVYNQLIQTAEQSSDLYDWLISQGTQPRRLLTANAIAATLGATQLDILEANPLVERVAIDHYSNITPATQSPGFQPPLPIVHSLLPETIEWNIAKIRANEAWDTFGITGEGAVVGIIDTGVQFDHPALVNSYRGNLGGSFDHNYNWFDFVNGEPVPYDPIGHGTMGAGIISGDDGAGTQIGVSPGADWIAVRACDYSCSDADLLAALDWMLAPTRLDGTGADPAKAPDIMLGMWGGPGCDTFFETSLQILRAAGILPVFSPGGGGSGCATMGSPADLAQTLAAGATDEDDVIASFSSRGPVLCSPDLIKPDLSAPGVNIRTSNNTGGYSTTSGTSWSAAHAAGAAALVVSANPSLSVDEVVNTLNSTAVCIEDLSCGGTACPDGANYIYGHGRIDVYEAVSAVIGQPYDLPWLDENIISGTLESGESLTISVTFNATGLQPGTYFGGISIESNDPSAPFTTLPVTLTVTEPCAPIEDLSIGISTNDPVVGEEVTFTAGASGTPPIDYTWDFDDGPSLIGFEVTHVFITPGIHIVRLTATNNCDWVDMEAEVWVDSALINFLLPLISR